MSVNIRVSLSRGTQKPKQEASYFDGIIFVVSDVRSYSEAK